MTTYICTFVTRTLHRPAPGDAQVGPLAGVDALQLWPTACGLSVTGTVFSVEVGATLPGRTCGNCTRLRKG